MTDLHQNTYLRKPVVSLLLTLVIVVVIGQLVGSLIGGLLAFVIYPGTLEEFTKAWDSPLTVKASSIFASKTKRIS